VGLKKVGEKEGGWSEIRTRWTAAGCVRTVVMRHAYAA